MKYYHLQFQIQATDKGEPPLSSDKLPITIRVIDVNNFLPGFTNDNTKRDVLENQPNGTVVGTVTAVDEDKDSVTCYNISREYTNSTQSTLTDIWKNGYSIIDL